VAAENQLKTAGFQLISRSQEKSKNLNITFIATLSGSCFSISNSHISHATNLINSNTIIKFSKVTVSNW